VSRFWFFGAELHPSDEIANRGEHSQQPLFLTRHYGCNQTVVFNLHVSCSSLRRVPEMPHSIFAKFQPVSQRIVPDPAHRARRLRVDPLLFLPYAAGVQSVGFNGLEAI
jgi:hypothetical protein